MKISYKWLNNIIDLGGFSLSEISDILISRGMEIESIEQPEPISDKVVVAQILEMKQHENADKLSVLRVNDGQQDYQVICGAKNMKAGDKVALATPSAKLPGGMKIKKSKLRGVLSEGMCCSLDELGLASDSEGIYIADKNEELGKPVNQIFSGDTILDIAVSPNRGDELSHFGIARELSYALNRPLKHKTLELTDIKNKTYAKSTVGIEVESSKCLAYYGMEFKDIELQESPKWLKDALISVGLRPINNIVDITNYVLQDFGQPLHAFDLDKIKTQKILVKEANNDFKYKALDEKEYNMKKGDLLITNGNDTLAIAGIIGGKDSEVSSETKNIFLECALFEADSVRITARRLNLSTDSSFRFERGIAYNEVEKAFWYAVSLIQELASPKETKQAKPFIADKQFQNKPIKIKLEDLNSFIGIDLQDKEFTEILKTNDYSYTYSDNLYMVKAPDYRLDVELDADIYEDVSKYYGIDNIEAHLPVYFEENKVKQSPLYDFKNLLTEVLSDFGLNQIVSYSFVSESNNKIFDAKNPIVLKNPIAEDFKEMRQSLLASILPLISKNINNKNNSLQVFEVAKVFGENTRVEGKPSPKETSFKERESLCAIFNGLLSKNKQWLDDNTFFDYFYAKGILERLTHKMKLRLDFVPFTKEDINISYINPYKSAKLLLNGEFIGVIAEFMPNIVQKYNLNATASFFEIDLNKLFLEYKKQKISYKKYSSYPSIRRDISMLVDKDFTHRDIMNIIKNAGAKFLSETNIYDLYTGDNISKDKKALAYYLIFNSRDKTLTDEDVDRDFKKVINKLQNHDKISMK